MARRVDLEPAVLWEMYKRLGSLRAVSRETGISHMVIRRRLLNAGFRLRDRSPNPEALNPNDKVYLRPRQIQAIDRLARGRGITRHALARELIDQALGLSDTHANDVNDVVA
ncbi:MAG: hypothetical protein VKI81_06285 [Synechococcaceae cyanobacterium]|nr:hypothetical protein [Synechococcaceae cyanobacterium]